jgi:predicted permease
MNDFLQDLRYGFRRLFRHPALNAVIVLTLALCIGASSALFSIIRHVLIEPFPYAAQHRIAFLVLDMPRLGREETEVSIPEYLQLGQQRQVFEHLMCGSARDVNLTGGQRPERVHAVAVTAGVFPMLGVRPRLGRVFAAAEDRPGAERVVVMSHDLWQRRFAAEPRVVGQPLRIEGQSYTVLGVMPRRFNWWGADLWFPAALDPAQSDLTDRSLTVMGRLRPGLDLRQAAARLDGLARRLERDHGAQVPEYRGFHFSFRLLLDDVLRDVRPALFVLLGVVALVFLIACANVANLFMAQASERRQEMSVRVAVGARRHRLVRQLLTESLLLALAGGLCGFLLAAWGIRLIASLVPFGYIPAEAELRLDGWAALFTIAVSVVAALLFGLAPALQTWKQSQVPSLKEGTAGGGRRSRRTRELLVVGEVTLALVVLVGAALMLQSFLRLTSVRPGFDADHVLTLRVALPADRYPRAPQVARFYGELERRVAALPGVVAAGAVNSLPLTRGPSDRFSIEGQSLAENGVSPEADIRTVTAGYFAAMHIPVVAGRAFTPRDDAAAPLVAIVGQTMVRRYFARESPLGKRIRAGAPEEASMPWATIVGVVADVKNQRLDADPHQQIYLVLPQRQPARRDMRLVVRTAVPPESIAEPVRQTVLALDPEEPVSQVQTMQKVLLDSLGARRLTVVLLIVFGGGALILAIVGIFAVLANSVAQRTHEIGIRMAVGAEMRQVVRMFVARGLELTLAGVALGLLVAAVSSRALSAFIYGVSAVDLPTFAAAALLFTATAALASWLPARRAARIDPTEALHHE